MSRRAPAGRGIQRVKPSTKQLSSSSASRCSLIRQKYVASVPSMRGNSCIKPQWRKSEKGQNKMNAYIFQSALICASCAKKAEIEIGTASGDPDKYPQGPYSQG